MGSFPMSVANNFCDQPFQKYLDSKTVLIYCPHPVLDIKIQNEDLKCLLSRWFLVKANPTEPQADLILCDGSLKVRVCKQTGHAKQSASFGWTYCASFELRISKPRPELTNVPEEEANEVHGQPRQIQHGRLGQGQRPSVKQNTCIFTFRSANKLYCII